MSDKQEGQEEPNMPLDVESFLRHWSDPSVKQDDAAFRLAHAHRTAAARIKELRASTLSFLQPVKNSKGAWVPGFASDAIDQASALGTEIEQTDEKLKSIAHDIETFLKLSEGNPTLTSITAKRNRLLDRVQHCERVAGSALKRALDKNPHELPATLMQRADISEAYAALEKAKAETAKPLADLDERLKRMREIIEPYEHEGNARGF